MSKKKVTKQNPPINQTKVQRWCKNKIKKSLPDVIMVIFRYE